MLLKHRFRILAAFGVAAAIVITPQLAGAGSRTGSPATTLGQAARFHARDERGDPPPRHHRHHWPHHRHHHRPTTSTTIPPPPAPTPTPRPVPNPNPVPN